MRTHTCAGLVHSEVTHKMLASVYVNRKPSQRCLLRQSQFSFSRKVLDTIICTDAFSGDATVPESA